MCWSEMEEGESRDKEAAAAILLRAPTLQKHILSVILNLP